MIYRTISLYDLINSEPKIGKDEIKKILSDFSCPLNPDVEYFMREKAYEFEKANLARTYLVYAQPKSKEPLLVGIYALGHSDIEVDRKLSRNQKRKIFGTTYALGKRLTTLLIGQLSKNYTDNNNQYITGDILLSLAFSRIGEIHKIFPSVVTHIDCKDDPNLRKFYEKHGFQLFKKKENDMLVYLTPTSQIIKNLAENEDTKNQTID